MRPPPPSFFRRLMLLLSTLLAFSTGQPAPTLPQTQETSVTISVTDLHSATGPVTFRVYQDQAAFLKKGQYLLRKIIRPNNQRQLSLPVLLPPGTYAVVVTQDVNDNGKFDTNFIGLPTEPYAFSNNVHPTLRPPRFEECQVTVAPTTPQVITISMKK